MVTLLGAMTLMLSFFHDLGDVFRDPKTRALLVWAAILLIIGTTFYALSEGWSLVDAFYFSVVTLTTVGYGDFSATTTAGKLLAVVYIFWGISIIVTCFGLCGQSRCGTGWLSRSMVQLPLMRFLITLFSPLHCASRLWLHNPIGLASVLLTDFC